MNDTFAYFEREASRGFFSRYFGSWRVFFHHFLILWGVAVIFLVPLGVVDFVFERNYVLPITEPFKKYVISKESSRDWRNTEIQRRSNQEIAREFKQIIPLVQENTITLITMLTLYKIFNVVVFLFLISALFIAIAYLSEKKEVTFSIIFDELGKRFLDIIQAAVRVFFYGFLPFLGGMILLIFSFLLMLKNFDADLLLSQDKRFDMSNFFYGSSLAFVAMTLVLIGLIVLLIRFHTLLLSWPIFIDKKLKPSEFISKAKEIAKDKFGFIFGNFFLASFFNSLLVIMLSLLAGIIFGGLYIGLSSEAIQKIATAKQVTFFYTIYPVIIQSLFFPVLVIFVYSLYKSASSLKK